MSSPRCCVIGAGPCGITAAKALLEAGLDVVVYDKNDQVGGNWLFSPEPSHSSVFETTHIISSKKLSQYSDYSWPASYPDYPGHRDLLAYFQGYARHFGVDPHVRFRTSVEKAEPDPAGGWRVTLATGESGRFDRVLVASGHHWDPSLPSWPGRFAGRLMHSHDFKSAAPFSGQRVLVVGGGNSACDIAVETARVSSFTGISMRRGYHFVPKFLLGIPSDELHEWFLFIPRPLRVRILGLLLRLLNGSWERYGLAKPDHPFMSTHPVVNSELLYSIRHGRVHPRPDVARLEGRDVHFADGRVESYDTILAATGFRISFPFLDRSQIDFSRGPVPLYLRAFSPRFPDLYFIGLFQPIGCIWPLAELQARLVARHIVGGYRLPADLFGHIAREVEHIRRTWAGTPRHTVEVDYHPFRRRLLRELKKTAA